MGRGSGSDGVGVEGEMDESEDEDELPGVEVDERGDRPRGPFVIGLPSGSGTLGTVLIAAIARGDARPDSGR